ncbi:MAG: branched-chain amino acid ABC transporter permease [Deltaproteobacteria bacterium]|nr:branched-chain amino acid ABC transporter permease [Deltaproteobacteria bacterium]
MLTAILEQSSLFLQQLVNGVTLGSIYALVAVGYTMVYGVIQLINFAHGEIYMLGAFISFSLLTGLFGVGLPFGLAVVIAVLVCALSGVLLDIVAYRPLRRAPRLAALITAIGMSIFLQNLALLIWGGQIKSFPRSVIPTFFFEPALEFGEIVISWLQVIILLTAIFLMLALQLVVHYTKIGRAMRAIAQDRTAASLMGVNVDRVVSYTFALGSGLGGVAGILVGLYYNAVYPTMGYTAGIKAFAAAVLGGIGSIPGAILGGGILGLAEVFGGGYISSSYSNGIAYAVMILVILVKPTGLFGRRLHDKA